MSDDTQTDRRAERADRRDPSDTGTRGRSRRRWYVIGGGVVAAAVVAWLAFGYFGVQAAFTDDEVDQAGPVFDSGASAVGSAAPSTTVPAVGGARGGAGGGADTPAPPATAAAPRVQALAAGAFVPRSHPASGTATVLGDGTGQRFLRFEDFATDNGPDLNVYLSAAPANADEAAFDDDFVDLGDLEGNVGDQNYEVPADVDLDRYPTVVIWCVRFGVAFGAADLV